MTKIIKLSALNIVGILTCAAIAILSICISAYIPRGLISGGVFALIIGIILNPIFCRAKIVSYGANFSSKFILKLSIVLMGFTLSFSQILEVGGFSIVVMIFTLLSAFGFGWLFGKLFKMDWKLSSLISAGTGICGGSAIAAISPVIKAKDSDIAYAIASTFIFDIIMVILFPILGKAFGMSDLGYGLWAGTAVNDTSSVVAAGFAFSDIAGNYSIIVKLTRTLSIIPIVIIFSIINVRKERKQAMAKSSEASDVNLSVQRVKPNYIKIIPWFIFIFLLAVAIKSTGIITAGLSSGIAQISKFLMVMALAGIGVKTNLKDMKISGFKPMLHGFIISLLVVVISFLVQLMFNQL